MTEPIYSYVPGKGWLAEPRDTTTYKLGCGTVVRLEFREPNSGEYYTAYSEHESWLYHFKLQPQGYQYKFFRLKDGPRDYTISSDAIYVTVVPV